MSEPPKSRGRGAAILEAIRRAQTEAVGAEAPSTSAPRPSGRGALIERIRAREAAAQIRPGEGAEAREEDAAAASRTRGGRGRAALLKRMQELQIGGAPELPPVETKPSPVVQESEPEEEGPTIGKYSGKDGRQTRLTANYVRISIEPDKGVFEYEVVFSQHIDSKSMRIKLLNTHRDKFGGIKSFDGGHCLYLPIKLPEQDTVIPCEHPGDGSHMTMTIKFKKQKRMKDCLHLFNVLFKRIMRTLLMFEFNRKFFNLKDSVFIPQHKLEVLPGYAVTCDEYEGGLMLCLDSQHKVLRTQTAYDLLVDLKKIARDRYKEEVFKILLGSSVLTKYNTKNYIVDEILWDATPMDTFSTNSGEISFLEYYKKQYNITIKDHHQPLLLNKKKMRKDPSGKEEERMVCLIPELCHLTGLTDNMRNDFKVMQSVAQYTRLTPAQRMRALKNYLDNVRKEPEARQILADWGLKLEEATIDLNARTLYPEEIHFGNDVKVPVGLKMDWTMELSRNKVCQPIDLINWAIIHTAKDQRQSMDFLAEMQRVVPPLGFKLGNPIIESLTNDRTTTVIQALQKIINPNLQCVVIICPTQRQDLYNTIKKTCCVHQPIASQVVLTRTLNKQRLRPIILKIALQINCKLGGTLWHLHIPAKKWMVCGIDTYHSPGQNYSWYGFAGTLNDPFSNYYSTSVKQTAELGNSLQVCLRKALIKYHELNGCYPTNLIVYRDGVGDGQLDMCKQHEIKQIKETFKSMDLNTELCFVVVQKRINTRLFAANRELENPVGGTIMDHTITKKGMFDFYLVSQHVGQGTVSPTHYICLENTFNIKPDVLQKLTNKMCHMYYNWSGTIRVPAPCQYAHKLAFLIGNCIQTVPDEKLSTRLYYL